MNETTSRDPPERSRERASRPATPLWVKLFGAIGLIVLLLFVLLHVSGHGFGGHSAH
jgi:hypothetical protein